MVKTGDIIEINTEWQDYGDSDYIWTAITDENPFTGYFKARVTPKNPKPNQMPHSVMSLESFMVTVCES